METLASPREPPPPSFSSFCLLLSLQTVSGLFRYASSSAHLEMSENWLFLPHFHFQPRHFDSLCPLPRFFVIYLPPSRGVWRPLLTAATPAAVGTTAERSLCVGQPVCVKSRSIKGFSSFHRKAMRSKKKKKEFTICFNIHVPLHTCMSL